LLKKYILYIVGWNKNHRYTVLQQTEESWPIISRPTLKNVMFYENIRRRICFVDITFGPKLCVCVCVTQLSNNDGLCRVRQIAVSWTIDCNYPGSIMSSSTKNWEKECHIDITEPRTLIHFSPGTLTFDASSLSCWQLR
jgi:hypothetical protein